MYAILKSGQDLLKFSNNSFIMVSAYGRIAAKRLVYAYLGTCMPCPCAEILDKGWDANKPQAKKEVIEDAPDQEEFFTVLYREYFNQIKLYAMAHISDPHRAEEIAQDTFHTAVEKIDTLMKADEPIRWLKRTAKNKIRNEQRTRQRYLKRYLSLDAPETPAVSSAGSVEDAIIEQEDKQQRASVEETIRQTLTPTEITMLKRIAIERN